MLKTSKDLYFCTLRCTDITFCWIPLHYDIYYNDNDDLATKYVLRLLF